MIQTKKLHWADKLGIINATLCIIHCLSLPILLSIGVNFLSNPLFAFAFIFVTFISIYNSTKGKNSRSVSKYLWVAFTGFVISTLFEEHSVLLEYGMYFFSIGIILGHIYNVKACLKHS